MFIGEMSLKRLLRFIPDEVNGTLQGTLVPFLDGNDLGNGNNRLAFDEQGNLWVGKTHLSWAGDEGLKKISWDGENDFDILKVKQIANGFRISFTKKVDVKAAASVANYSIKKYTFEYNSKYGSPRKNEKAVTANSIRVAQDGLSIDLSLPPLSPGHVYQFEADKLKSANGESLASSLFCYNLIELVAKEYLP
jgi:hypothetical protein